MNARLFINGVYSGDVSDIVFEQVPEDPSIYVNGTAPGWATNSITMVFAAPACIGRQWPLWRVRNWWRRLRGLE